jgi:hypothetical protein
MNVQRFCRVKAGHTKGAWINCSESLGTKPRFLDFSHPFILVLSTATTTRTLQSFWERIGDLLGVNCGMDALSSTIEGVH